MEYATGRSAEEEEEEEKDKGRQERKMDIRGGMEGEGSEIAGASSRHLESSLESISAAEHAQIQWLLAGGSPRRLTTHCNNSLQQHTATTHCNNTLQ